MSLSLLFYYLFCSSAVFVYGIGLKQALMKSSTIHYFGTTAIKTFLTILFSLPVVWGLSMFFVKRGFAELYPLILIITVILISKIIDSVTYLLKGSVSAGILLPSSIMLLAVNESITLLEAYTIAAGIFLSVFLLLPLLYAIRKRLNNSMPPKDFKYYAVAFFSAAFIFFAFFAYHFSWFNQEFFK
ncbi:MAG: hypothetical protein J5798_08690 [Spirochaetaceae bacterium]|nr:hypothetical protein [Spirochaetaceae bacterium]MBR4825109.1 hypothetical protein [Spirochaetaceae bacterium]